MKSPRWVGVSVAVSCLAAAITIVACGKGDGPGSPSSVNSGSSQSVASTPAPVPTAKPIMGNSGPGTGICAGKISMYSSDNTLQICQLGTTFTQLDNRVQKVPESGGSWTVTLGVISQTAGYFIDSTFGSNGNSGGAIGPDGNNQGNGPYNKRPFPAGESRVDITLTRGPGCGSEQEDIDAKNAGGAQMSAFSVVFTHPTTCTTCADGDLAMTHTESVDEKAGKITSTMTIVLKVSKLNFTINWGDNATEKHNVAGAYTHTYSIGDTAKTYKVSVKYGSDRGECDPGYDVTATPITPMCSDVKVELGFCPETSSVASSVSKCFAGSWVNPGTGTLAYGDSGSDSVENPFKKSHSYNQIDAEQNLTATLTVVRGQLSCPKTIAVKIPPRDKSCSDYTPPSITGDISSDVQTAQVVFDKGSVGPAGGTFSNRSLPATVVRPNWNQPAGSLSTTYTLPFGPEGLECRVSKTFTKPVPPKVATCADYSVVPVVFGAPVTSQTDTAFTISSVPVTPAGGVYVPSLPIIAPRPLAGASAAINLDYAVTYSPAAGLSCPTSGHLSIPIPPQTSTCSITHAEEAVNGCYNKTPGWPHGNTAEHICSFYGLKALELDADPGALGSYKFSRAARLAVIHWGGAECGGGDQYYGFYENVTLGQRVFGPSKGGSSFVAMCGCLP